MKEILEGGYPMKVDRLVSIIMILLDKKRIGAQELADMFEVSPRTIYRDIDAINMAGIPVRSTSGVGGGFEIMPEYNLDKNVFSNSDLTAIFMGLSSLSNMIRGNELVNALDFIENDYYYNILFSFGDKCECLEPLHIRKEMKRRTHDIAAIYES